MKSKKLVSLALACMMLLSLIPAVSLAAGTVTVEGSDVFVSAPVGKYSKMAYTAKYNDGTADVATTAADFNWSVTKEGAPATDVWCVDGDLIVKGGAEGTYVLKAVHKTDTAAFGELSITVKKSTLYDAESSTALLTNVSASEDTDGNKYMAYGSGIYNGKNPNTDINTVGSKTLMYKFRVGSEWKTNASDGTKYFLVDTSWKFDTRLSYYQADNNKYWIESKTNNKYLASQLAVGTWYELKIEFDMKKGTYTWYVGGKAYSGSENLSIPSGMGSTYRFNTDIDDVIVYSGTDYTPSLEIDGDKSVLIPQTIGGKAELKFEASSLTGGSDNIKWSILNAPTGVEIDENTGIVTVRNSASDSTVKVEAEQNGVKDTATLTLKSINLDFESNSVGDSLVGTPWDSTDSALVSEDDGNKYITFKQGGDDIRYYITDCGSDNLSTVVEFKAKGAEASFYAASETWFNLNPGTLINDGKWHDVKFVVDMDDPSNAKISAFFDGALIYNRQDYTLNDKKLAVRMLSFTKMRGIDDIKIYNITNTKPRIYDAYLADVPADSSAVVKYNYFDDGGMDGTVDIKWYMAESKDDDYSLIEGASGDTISTNGMDGKFLKAVLTPSHANRFNPAEIITGDAVEVYCSVTDTVIDIDITSDADKISMTVSAYATGEVKKDLIVALATYSSDGKELLDVDMKTLSTETAILKDTTVAIAKSNVKAFVWDSIGLKPLYYEPIK